MENVNVPAYRVATVRPRTALKPAHKGYSRPLADRLEWVALIVLPLSSLVAAVSLLGQAIR